MKVGLVTMYNSDHAKVSQLKSTGGMGMAGVHCNESNHFQTLGNPLFGYCTLFRVN